MSAGDALTLHSQAPAAGLAAPGGGAGDDGDDDPSPRKPPHTLDHADPTSFPEEEEEEEEEEEVEDDDENPSPQPSWNQLQPQGVPEGGRRQYCRVCNKMFRSAKALHGHMRSHPLRNWRGTVPPHMKGAENEVADYLLLLSGQEPERRKRRFICSSCNREFPTRQALGGHRASHKGQKGCYEKAKEAREYGPRLSRRGPPTETKRTAAGPPPTEQVAMHYLAAASSSSSSSVAAGQPKVKAPPFSPAAAEAAAPPPPRAAKRSLGKGAPEAATRRRRLLDLNMAPVSSSEDNGGGGSSTSSGSKAEDAKKDSSYEESKPHFD